MSAHVSPYPSFFGTWLEMAFFGTGTWTRAWQYLLLWNMHPIWNFTSLTLRGTWGLHRKHFPFPQTQYYSDMSIQNPSPYILAVNLDLAFALQLILFIFCSVRSSCCHNVCVFDTRLSKAQNLSLSGLSQVSSSFELTKPKTLRLVLWGAVIFW